MTILITGGCGFIGSNVAMGFHKDGHKVVVIDDLSRPNVQRNREWLQDAGVSVVVGDFVLKTESMQLEPDVVFHLAGQVGVQTSIDNPTFDFDTNLVKTFKLLEYLRKLPNKPLIVFASTNKVYGDIQVSEPVNELQPLHFCTPYGCSKGGAEQYILDYDKTLGLPGVVLRMSCVYGNRQMGTEEQGWLCHFTRNRDNHVTIYGDGEQVRDALYIDDYVELCKQLVANKDKVRGQAFNIGGGEKNVISVNEALQEIGNSDVEYTDWRPSDQRYYVSDITKIKETIGWEPKIGLKEGLSKLDKWCQELAS